MISIVMPYFNRRQLLLRTLSGFKSYKEDFEVVIVDDASTYPIGDIPGMFPFDIKLIRIEQKDKKHVNPCIGFNIGIRHSTGDKVILQNPECAHVGDVLGYINKNLGENDYMSFACYSLGPRESKLVTENSAIDLDILVKSLPHRSADKVGGNNSWYNHSVIRPRAYHFVSAITRNALYDINGFDERFATGSGWDDDDLIRRIRIKGMDVKIVDEPYSVHLWHPANLTHRAPPNRDLFNKIKATENTHRAKVGIQT